MATGIGIKSENTDLRQVGTVKQDARLVAESIHRILNTFPWERPRERVGCRIRELLFDPNDNFSASLGGYYVSKAIEEYEPRVKINEIIPVALTAPPNENKLYIKLIFSLKEDPDNLFSTQVRITI